MEVETQRAVADLAKALQTAKTQQRITNEEIGIQLIERQKKIQVMEQEIERQERIQEATVKEPAKVRFKGSGVDGGLVSLFTTENACALTFFFFPALVG